jgi:hypothetical protein
MSSANSGDVDIFGVKKLFEDPDESITGVILPGELLPMIVPQCSRPTMSEQDKSWMPSLKLIRELESLLPGYIKTKNIDLGPEGLARFYRQYLGVYVDGKKYIYVNAFSKTSVKEKEKKSAKRMHFREKATKRVLPEILDLLGHSEIDAVITNWKYVPVKVCHGRKSHFGVYYNTEVKALENFNFNM